MAIEFNCPGCSRLLRVGEDAVGRQAQCPECGTLATVPATLGVAQPAGQQSPFAAGAAPSPPPGQAQNPYQAPGAAWPQTPPPGGWASVPNYLVQAILCTLFCCLPFGIVAIVYAAQVNGKLAAGDYHGARQSSDSARMWCWVSFWLGLAPLILWLLLAVLGAVAGM